MKKIILENSPSSLRKGRGKGDRLRCKSKKRHMQIPVREYKQIIKNRARDLRNNPTNAEKAMWEILRMGRFKGLRFLRQHPILFHINNAVHFFIPDFYCPQHKLIIEVDGDIHDKQEQKEYDVMRTGMLEDMSFRVVRFKNEDVIGSSGFVTSQILSFTK